MPDRSSVLLYGVQAVGMVSPAFELRKVNSAGFTIGLGL